MEKMKQKWSISLNKQKRIEVSKIVKLIETDGSIGLAKLVYTGYNPFHKREINGFSLHNSEEEIKGFVYLPYFQKLVKKYMPSEYEVKHQDRDEELSYRREDLKEILEITKNMHNHPEKNQFITQNIYDCLEGDDFRYFVSGNKNREGQRILNNIMRIILYNDKSSNIIMKDKGSFIIKK